MVLVYVARR